MPSHRQCATPGCREMAEDYSTLCISCQLEGRPEVTIERTAKRPNGRPRTPVSSNAVYTNRHYHRRRLRGYTGTCAAYRHTCRGCVCECHEQEKVT